MKKWMSIILGTVVAVMSVMSVSVSALAAENPSVSIPVSVSLSGTQPEKAEDFTIKLSADDASYPMPEGAEDGSYTMTITGAQTKNLPAISFDRVGVYTYTIAQVAGSSEKCTYDKTVYTLNVYITNAEDESGLEATAVLYPGDEGEKQTAAAFENVYETVVPSPSPTPTPTPTPTATPTPTPTATPTPTPTVTPTPTPTVTPTPTPTPTPAKTTPKTGDDSKPVLYVVLAAASLCVIGGLVLTRKGKKTEQ